MRLLILVLLVSTFVELAFAGPFDQPRVVEGRAIWIDANSIPTNDQAMSSFVDSLAKANLNILLPEAIRRGYTIYPSRYDDQDPKWKGYDPLAALIREAHARGMEVHPWVWVFRQGYSQDQGPIFKAHPDWMAVNKWGDKLSANGGYWICPSIPEARDYLVSLFKEMAVNYSIDGLHLDYIRFENQFPAAYCYNSSCRDCFMERYGIDPMAIDPLSENQVKWHLWRENLVNSFVQKVCSELKTIKPSLKISAAVGSRPETARRELLQNWPNWVDNRWVDFVTPMAYTGDNTTFCDMVTAEEAAVDSKTILMPGLGLHTHKTADTTLDQIGISRSLGAEGETLFASVYLKDDLRNALLSGPFSDKAEIPFRKTPDRVKTLLDAAQATRVSDPAASAEYLRAAARLQCYVAYRCGKFAYIEPTRPPLVIPESILPIPSVAVPKTKDTVNVDGKLDETVWSSAAKIQLAYTEMGCAATVPTEVLLAYDDKNLYIGYRSSEASIGQLKETVTKRDGPAFYDDSVEMFLDPWGKRHEYYQLASNLPGALFDAKVNSTAVNLDWKSQMVKGMDGWTAELAIPFSSLAVPTPKSGDKWFANFARNRWVTGKPEYFIWSAPYGSFNRTERFGVISFE